MRRSNLLVYMVSSIIYTVLSLVVFRELYLLVLTPFIAVGSGILYSIAYSRYTQRLVDKNLVQLLSLLYGFESIGMHFNDLLHAIASGDVEVSGVYKRVAREYVVLEKIYGEPISSLSKLSRLYSGTRFSRFLQGYVDILATTGDTLSYVENCIDSELEILYNKSLSLVGLIENFYESYLIILLSIIVLSGLPVASFIHSGVYSILLLCSLVGYTIAVYVSRSLYYSESSFSLILSYIYITASCILPLYMGVSSTIAFLIIYCIVAVLYSRLYYSWRISVEDRLVDFLEDLYSETRQGFSVDKAIIRLSGRDRGYSVLVSGLSKLLSLGLNGSMVASRIDTSPLVVESMRMLLTPLEYSSEHYRHVGYTTRLIRRIYSVRERVLSRARILYIYTLILPVTIYSIVYGLKAMSTALASINPYDIPGYIVAASVPAWVIACKSTTGYSMYSWKNLLILLENVLLYTIIASL